MQYMIRFVALKNRNEQYKKPEFVELFVKLFRVIFLPIVQ